MTVYYPYFRAKQFDVIAVEQATPQLVANKKITPILEPVKVSSSAFVKRGGKIGKAGLTFGLVMNPNVGELVGSPLVTKKLLVDLKAKGANVVPAFIVDDATQMSDLATFALLIPSGSGGIYLHQGVPRSATAVTALRAAPNAVHVLHDGATSSAHETTFPHRIRLKGGFQSQARNASYPPRSFFGDLHLTHKALGFAGFADRTTLSDVYSASGGPAYAVAIHMTEDCGSQGIYCNHFVSTSNATTANPAGKFGEAVAALHAYTKQTPGKLDFSAACKELLQHHSAGTFPGLGDLKRMSIQHHLELMATLV